ncbi:kinase-like domain-containing protein [Phaeosphaeriaceae sp. PMI808]|nr:kinase-like domain-containing protein [Phaeosphaeriaceae sp. PMI808]
MAQQGCEADLLRQWFPTALDHSRKAFTENDIRSIADVLERTSQKEWSRIPRIYSILRKIGQLNIINAFLDSGITDASFPFSKNTLPEALNCHSERSMFLDLQHLVFNAEALNLENGRHGHFSNSTEVPLKRIKELGKGGFGYVDHVFSTISYKEYARKLISRGRTGRKDRQVLQAFTKEVANLKRLSHIHLVDITGSYTDKKFFAIIMLPVADCNMQAFLGNLDPDVKAQSLLRSFFGCLTSALSYLHDNKIRHKDIKPSNVLVKDDQVFLADFGTAMDWSELDNSTTMTAPPTTPRYCAPEVMGCMARNSSSDIWSLGCVFLEMWTVLKRQTVDALREHIKAQNNQSDNYHCNIHNITSWIERLSCVAKPACDNLPAVWISRMLQLEPMSRWSAHIIENRIREANTDPDTSFSFSGMCCLEPGDTTSDSSHSEYEYIEEDELQPNVVDKSLIIKSQSAHQESDQHRRVESPIAFTLPQPLLLSRATHPDKGRDLERNNVAELEPEDFKSPLEASDDQYDRSLTKIHTSLRAVDLLQNQNTLLRQGPGSISNNSKGDQSISHEPNQEMYEVKPTSGINENHFFPGEGHKENKIPLDNLPLLQTTVMSSIGVKKRQVILKDSIPLPGISLSLDVPRVAFRMHRTGLQNFGATDFMNAVVQCLTGHPQLSNFFSSDQYRTHLQKDCIVLEAYVNLLKHLSYNDVHNIRPSTFTKICGQLSAKWKSDGRRDPLELLECILQTMHKALNFTQRTRTKPAFNQGQNFLPKYVAKSAWERYEFRNESFCQICR